MKVNWDNVCEILDRCKSLVIGDKEIDALDVTDMIALHKDACVLASAIIISEAILNEKEERDV